MQVALAAIWRTTGLVSLAVHTMVTMSDWAHEGYEHARQTMERARDDQVNPKQTLQYLAEANLQRTRLQSLSTAMRQLAEEAQEAKQEFLANVSHELRTPLNMIICFAQLIMQAPESYGEGIPQTLLADLDVILRNSRHLSSLVNDILDLSQIQTGPMVLSKDRVRFQDVLQGATIAVGPLFEAKGHQRQLSHGAIVRLGTSWDGTLPSSHTYVM